MYSLLAAILCFCCEPLFEISLLLAKPFIFNKQSASLNH